MPLMTMSQINQGTVHSDVPKVVKPTEQETTFAGTVAANFGLHSPITTGTRAAERYFRGQIPSNEGTYNPFNTPENLEGYDPARFINVKTPQMEQYVKDRIDQENKMQDYINASPTLHNVAGMLLAGTFGDPFMAAPVIKGVALARTAERVSKGMLEGAAYTGGSVAASEGILQATSETRDMEDSFYSVAAGTVLGASLGGVIAAVTTPARQAAQSVLAKALKGEDLQIIVDPITNIPRVERSAGAAEAKPLNYEDEGIAYLNEKFVKSITGPYWLRSPIMNGLLSDSPILRAATNRAFIHNVTIGADAKGIAREASAESKIRLDEGEAHKVNKAVWGQYLEYTGQGALASAVSVTRKRGLLSPKEWDQRISKGLSNSEYVDTIPQVNNAIKLRRAQLDKKTDQLVELDMLKKWDEEDFFRALHTEKHIPANEEYTTKGLATHLDKLKKEGIIPETFDLTKEVHVKDYLPRIYNVPHLLTSLGAKAWVDKIGNLYRTTDLMGFQRTKLLSEEDAKALAQDSLNRILHHDDNAAAHSNFGAGMTSGNKSLKPRTIRVPDEFLEEFLIRDSDYIVNQYVKKMDQAIRAKELLRTFGVDTIDELQIKLNDEYMEAQRALSGPVEERVPVAGMAEEYWTTKARDRTPAEIAATDKKLAQLAKNYRRNKQQLQNSYDLLTGNAYKASAYERAMRTLLQYQTLRLLGGVLVSNLVEVGMAPLRLGLARVLRDGYGALLSNFKLTKLSMDEWKDAGIGIESEMTQTLSVVGGMDDAPMGHMNNFDRGMAQTMDVFGKATGITPWTGWQRRFAAHMVQSDLIRFMDKVEKGYTPSQSEIVRLAKMGISKEKYQVLIDGSKTGEGVIRHKGAIMSNYTKWQHKEAQALFQSAVQREVESIILKPSRGDIPMVFQSSGLGRIIFQFKSFMASATNKILIPALQQRDARTMAGIAQLILMGGFIQMIRDTLAGRDPTENIDKFILDGFANSGVVGLLATVPLGLAQMAYNPSSRPFVPQAALGAVVGPSGNQIQQLTDTAMRMGDGDLSAKDIEALRKNIPLGNFLWFNQNLRKTLIPTDQQI